MLVPATNVVSENRVSLSMFLSLYSYILSLYLYISIYLYLYIILLSCIKVWILILELSSSNDLEVGYFENFCFLKVKESAVGMIYIETTENTFFLQGKVFLC